jgi:hypothetical protein
MAALHELAVSVVGPLFLDNSEVTEREAKGVEGSPGMASELWSERCISMHVLLDVQ